jgi:hypothetical protein
MVLYQRGSFFSYFLKYSGIFFFSNVGAGNARDRNPAFRFSAEQGSISPPARENFAQ